MNELKPCPACGGPVVIDGGNDWHNKDRFFICCKNPECGCCRVGDTVREQCIERWSALPRALVWTTESPKVPGFYFQEFMYGNKKNLQTIEVLPEDHWLHPKKKWEERNGKFDGLLQIGRGIGPIRKDARWAGPIPEPQETRP